MLPTIRPAVLLSSIVLRASFPCPLEHRQVLVGGVGRLVGLTRLPGYPGHRPPQVGSLGRQVLDLARPHLSGCSCACWQMNSRLACVARMGWTGEREPRCSAAVLMCAAAVQPCRCHTPFSSQFRLQACKSHLPSGLRMGDLQNRHVQDRSAQHGVLWCCALDASPRLSSLLRAPTRIPCFATPHCTPRNPHKGPVSQLSTRAPAWSSPASLLPVNCTVRGCIHRNRCSPRRAGAAKGPLHRGSATASLLVSDARSQDLQLRL